MSEQTKIEHYYAAKNYRDERTEKFNDMECFGKKGIWQRLNLLFSKKHKPAVIMIE